MVKVKKVAGIDISKAFFDVFILSSGEGCSRRFTNDPSGFLSLAKLLDSDVHCIMEVTGPYYMRLAVFLHQNGFAVTVVNPLVIKRYCQMRLVRAKTDKADARLIAQYGLQQDLPTWTPPEQFDRNHQSTGWHLRAVVKATYGPCQSVGSFYP